MPHNHNTLHIIHLPHRADRWEKLQFELETQSINDFTICEGIYHDLPFKGIAQAHSRIVAMAKRLKWPKVRIAEDDIKFTAPGAYDYYLSQEPARMDIYLGSITYGVYDNKQELVEDFAGLTLYTIYSPFFDTFLSVSPEEHIDRGLRYKGRYSVCQPMVAMQHEGFSDNHQKIVNYRSCFKDAALHGL